MRRLRPLFYLNDDLAFPLELAGVEASLHERVVQEALRATRQTWEILLLRAARWLVDGCALLAAGWFVLALCGGRSGPGGSLAVAASLLLLLLPLLELFRWRGSVVEERLFRCALREAVWRAKVVPTVCFDCGTDLQAPESQAGGACPGCGAALLRTEDAAAPRLVRGRREDPFHRGLEHATELRHLQHGERRRLAGEARMAARRNPLVRTLHWMGCFVGILGLALCVLRRWTTVGAPAWLPLFFLFLLCGHALFLTADTLGKRVARRQLRQGLFLARRPPASCFRCKSSLAGVTASRCPSCGAALLPESS